MRHVIECAGVPVRRFAGIDISTYRRTGAPAHRQTLLPLLAAIALLAGACANPSDSQTIATPTAGKAEETLQVTVVPVSFRPTKRLLKFVGTLFGNQEVTLSSQVEGQIEKLSVDLGDHVTQGQVLAEVDDTSARAQLREVEARLAKARADEARGRELMKSNVISPQEYEQMQTNVAVAEAQRDGMNVQLEHKHVRSPLTGAVVKRLVSVGEYVRPGTPLFDLVADDPLTLRGDVPERFADEVAVGQPVQIKVDAYPDDAFEGRLLRVSPAANAENRSITVEAEVPNADHRLKPGFFSAANIVTRADDEALVVPETAVVTFAGVTKLFVVRDGIAYERHVRVGTRDDQGLVEVIEGLHADEVVATSGLAKLENGMAVAVRKGDS
ncbi:MAG: efflux RND transporter periplasmic adaptor subunit [Deltaproteobacteria bacterium]|nr:efflux RND transporter periplasmic adaptor subunit [Deltaproteobacteria bacterium]